MFVEIWGHDDPTQHVQAIQSALSRHEAVGNLKAAYSFFSAALNTWLAEDTSHAEHLFNTLKHHLQVVRIDLMPGDDAQVIFETLNARGEPLQAADLIRNFIFQQVETQKLPVEHYFQTYWAEFDEDRSFWRQLVSRGRVRRDQLTWFLAYFLTVQHAREISEINLFHEFKVWWSAEAQASRSVKERLDELKHYAQAYLKLMNAAPDSRLGLLAHRLEALDTTTLTPILLFLLTHAELTPAELDGILLNLESYLVRRFTCGLTSKNYNQRFLTFLTRLKADPATRLTTKYVREFLSEGEGDSVRWPDDQEFLQHLTQDALYRTVKPRGVVMLLEAAELTRHTDKQEKLLFAGKSSVEHVMPRRWETHWDAPEPTQGLDNTALVSRRNHMLHTLGNLTLLTSKLNSSLSNSAFQTKKPAITKQTLRLLNSDFQDVDVWNEQNIEKRSALLAGSLLTVWPAPQPSSAQQAPGTLTVTPVAENLSIFDQWLSGKYPQYFRAEPFESEDRQGVQFVPRQWSRNWKVRIYAHEEAGEDRLTLEVREDFGDSDTTKPLARKVFSQLLEPLRLSFGDLLEEHSEEDKYVIHLDPEAKPKELQTILSRVMELFLPRIARALCEDAQGPTASDLNNLVLAIWPSLPEGYMFLPEEMDDRSYRRIPKVGWLAPPDLHFEIGQKPGQPVVVSLHDEVGKAHPLKAALRSLWPQLISAAQQGTGHPITTSRTTNNQTLDLQLPVAVAADDVRTALLHLIEETQTLLKQCISPA